MIWGCGADLTKSRVHYLGYSLPREAYFGWEEESHKGQLKKSEQPKVPFKQLFVSATPYDSNISGENKLVLEAYSYEYDEEDDAEEMMNLPSFDKFAKLFCGGLGCRDGIWAKSAVGEKNLNDAYKDFTAGGGKDIIEKLLKSRMVRHERTRLQGGLEKHIRKSENLYEAEMKEILCNTVKQSRRLEESGYCIGARKWSCSLPWILCFSRKNRDGSSHYKCLTDPEDLDRRDMPDELFVYDAGGRVKEDICSLPEQNLAFYQICKENVGEDMRQLLWVPPTMPWYDSGDTIFSRCKNYSKLLAFFRVSVFAEGRGEIVE